MEMNDATELDGGGRRTGSNIYCHLHSLLGMSAGNWKGLPDVQISLNCFHKKKNHTHTTKPKKKKQMHPFQARIFAVEHFKQTR
jgi:hypothetical protein